MGGHLKNFWASKDASPRVVLTLKEGCNLSFKVKPPLTRNSIVKSGYANPPQEQLPAGGIAFPFRQAGHRIGQGPILSGLLQLPVLGPQAEQQVASHIRSKLSEQVPCRSTLYHRDSRVNNTVATNRRMGHLPRFQRDLFSHLYKYLRFHCQNQTFKFTAVPSGLSTAPMEFTTVVNEVKLMGQACHIWIHQYLDG